MGSFDLGRAIGAALMTFAIFVIVQFVLSKIPALSQRYAVTAGIAFVLAALLLVATPAPTDVAVATGALFLGACIWHAIRYRKAPPKV
jgi:Mg2+/Co2+ transporter CorB